MKAAFVTVIAPLGRREDLPNLWACFCQQVCADKRLVVVENGDAVGVCKAFGLEPTAVLTSEKHQSHAKNAGLQWCREHGGGYWATFDSDDWYGPRYLTELLKQSHRADIVGKCAQWVRTAGGTLRLFRGTAENAEAKMLRGPTLGGWAEDAIDFPSTMRWGEDGNWVARMQERGATCYATSRYHYMYRREPGARHTWAMTDWQLAQSETGTVCDAGPEDLEVVVGAREPTLEQVPHREPELWDNPGWALACGGRPIFNGEKSQTRMMSFLLNTSQIFTATRAGAGAALRIERVLRDGDLKSLSQQDSVRLNMALTAYERAICQGLG